MALGAASRVGLDVGAAVGAAVDCCEALRGVLGVASVMRRVLVMDLRTILMMVLIMILMRGRKLTINCGGC